MDKFGESLNVSSGSQDSEADFFTPEDWNFIGSSADSVLGESLSNAGLEAANTLSEFCRRSANGDFPSQPKDVTSFYDALNDFCQLSQLSDGDRAQLRSLSGKFLNYAETLAENPFAPTISDAEYSPKMKAKLLHELRHVWQHIKSLGNLNSETA